MRQYGVTLLPVPFRLMYPCALFFIATGVYSTNSSLFEVYETLFFGVAGAALLVLEFPVAPILLGFVLGPLVEENFRRALLLARGRLEVFVERPISGTIIGLCALLLALQVAFGLRGALRKRRTGQGTLADAVAPLSAVPDVE